MRRMAMGDYPDTTWDGDPMAPWNADGPSGDETEPMWEHQKCGTCRFSVIGFGSNGGICAFDGDLVEVNPTTAACADWERRSE